LSLRFCRKVSEIAVKHIIERTAGREGIAGLIELIMNNTHDDRILWRALRSIRELIVSENSHIDAETAPSSSTSSANPFVTSPKKNKTNKEIIQESNPDIWLIEIFLIAYPNHRMIQSQVMRFIGTYAFGNDLFRRKIGERNIMKFILSNLQQFPNDEMILLHSTMALTNLTHGSKENRSR
jgi:hypothetical protein